MLTDPDFPVALARWREQVREEIRCVGPREAFARLIARNDALIRQSSLDDGRWIGAARAAIHTELVRSWASEEHRRSGYDRPFAVVALGGTGRGEVAPCSDLDFAFLLDDSLEGNAFLRGLQRQVLDTDAFRASHGFWFQPLPFNLDDIPRLDGKQLNAFLDLDPVHDPAGLAPRFRERIRDTFDPFEHFLHVRGFWKDRWEKAAAEVERLDQFDIKNDGLRVFLAGVWALAGRQFRHSHEVYQELDDPRDLDAYHLLFRVRCFIHLRRGRPGQAAPAGSHPEDTLGFEDFLSFDEMLGPDSGERERVEFADTVRARLLAARRRVARFARAIIDRELKQGRQAGAGSGIVYGVGGLVHTASARCQTPAERSSAVLSLLLASQRYGVPIDPAELQRTFRDAGDWMTPVPELAALFHEPRGSLADSFEFLSQFENAEDRLFPGYARFEVSLDDRVMTERRSLRGALERQKMRILEGFVREGRRMLTQAVSRERLQDVMSSWHPEVEAALLDAEDLAGVKLALKTKRLPRTPDDLRVRADTRLPLHERLASGMSDIDLEAYYRPYHDACGFSAGTTALAEFLVANRRAFKERAGTGPRDVHTVQEFAALTRNESRLRALFVFTCADRAEWQSMTQDPIRWFNTHELYAKTMLSFRHDPDPARALRTAGFSRAEQELLLDFGPDLFSGVYGQYAAVLGYDLLQLERGVHPVGARARLVSDGGAPLIGVAARDAPGLAACVTGALWHAGVGLYQAHCFSAGRLGLALDFFHLAPGGPRLTRELLQSIETAVRLRHHIGDEEQAALPALQGSTTLEEWRPGQYCLRHETAQSTGDAIYALSYRVYRHLGGNIFGLVAHPSRSHTFVSVYVNPPPGLSVARAREIVAEHFE